MVYVPKHSVRRIMAGLLIVAFVAGCEMSSSQRYQFASITYTRAVTIMAALSLSGEVSVEDMERFNVIREQAGALLSEWEAALGRGEEFTGAQQFDALLMMLLTIQLELENDHDGGVSSTPGGDEARSGYLLSDPSRYRRAA